MILYSPILAVQQPGNKETDVTSNTTARNCNNDDADGSNECQGCSKVLFMAHRAISDQPALLFSCIIIKRSKIKSRSYTWTETRDTQYSLSLHALFFGTLRSSFHDL